jgi:hypothetical protein
MQGGAFEARKRIVRENFTGAIFRDIHFSGRFSQCDFGSKPGKWKELGGLYDCNFSAAVLNDCRLFNVNIERCQFAEWPTVVLESPGKNASRLLSYGLPKEWRYIVNAYSEEREYCTGVVLDIGEYALRYGGDVERLRETFLAVPFIRIEAGTADVTSRGACGPI